MPRQLVKYYLWVCLSGCFLKGLAYEFKDQIRKITFTNGASSNSLRARVEQKAEEG